jgi:glycosyltransferase involved in cell wall biosynthesis
MALFDEIGRRVLAAADLVVAVSEPLRKQLLDLGVGEERILINPNGVLAERFDPDSHAAARPATRAHLGAREDDVVVTFVGTFGPWHGAEVFARAALLVPEAVRAKFVFIGDGPGRPRTEAILRDAGALDRAAFTGLVPQDETPAYLAASDVCVSPHVPNADGSTFFGSPTKLFEYMASGRAIVASRLGQIGEVLEHGRNGWLVPPGDARALADAIVLLASEPELRGRLGGAAAADAIREHTWDAHVARILERLGTPR